MTLMPVTCLHAEYGLAEGFEECGTPGRTGRAGRTPGCSHAAAAVALGHPAPASTLTPLPTHNSKCRWRLNILLW